MSMPPDGAVVADLPTLKLYIGARTTQDDVILQERLAVATQWVYERVKQIYWQHPDVQEAILLWASKLYKRRQSPEGVAGWGGAAGFGTESAVARIVIVDPDVEALIERYRDYTNAGLA